MLLLVFQAPHVCVCPVCVCCVWLSVPCVCCVLCQCYVWMYVYVPCLCV